MIISTKDETIVSTRNCSSDIEYFQPYSHEEVDTRILRHVAHCARQGLRKVVIRTVDTGVVVLAIRPFPALRLDELWVSFGVSTHFRQIAIHEIVKNVNEKALTLFYAISGCDTVSSFLGRGKKSAWLAWSYCPSVADAFLLSLQHVDLSSETLEKIERFTAIMYSRTCSVSGVNEARKELFAQGSRTMENIPTTNVALLQHMRRPAYQAGHVWSHALVPIPILPRPALWGWLTSDSGWKPF